MKPTDSNGPNLRDQRDAQPSSVSIQVSIEEVTAKVELEPEAGASNFSEELVKKYPRANRKVPIGVSAYGIGPKPDTDEKMQSLFICPYGMQFQTTSNYPEGTLLKIQVNLPNYWSRKQKFVEYSRVDAPDHFRILAKVVKAEDVGKRGKKRIVLVQTVNIDSVDEQVLKTFLQEG